MSASASASSIVTLTRNSAGAIKNLSAQIASEAKGLDSEKVFTLTGRALFSLQDQINQMLRFINGLATVLSGAGLPGATALAEFTLTTATTNITPPISAFPKALLAIIIITDATPGREITWDASFNGVTPDDIDNNANMTNLYLFIGRSDATWWLISSELGKS